jgi:hypothetical protein
MAQSPCRVVSNTNSQPKPEGPSGGGQGAQPLTLAGIGSKNPRPAGTGKRAGDGIRTHREPLKSSENPMVLPGGAPKALPAVWPPVIADADLRSIVDAWPTLPDALKAGIVAMVRAAMA